MGLEAVTGPCTLNAVGLLPPTRGEMRGKSLSLCPAPLWRVEKASLRPRREGPRWTGVVMAVCGMLLPAAALCPIVFSLTLSPHPYPTAGCHHRRRRHQPAQRHARGTLTGRPVAPYTPKSEPLGLLPAVSRARCRRHRPRLVCSAPCVLRASACAPPVSPVLGLV